MERRSSWDASMRGLMPSDDDKLGLAPSFRSYMGVREAMKVASQVKSVRARSGQG